MGLQPLPLFIFFRTKLITQNSKKEGFKESRNENSLRPLTMMAEILENGNKTKSI